MANSHKREFGPGPGKVVTYLVWLRSDQSIQTTVSAKSFYQAVQEGSKVLRLAPQDLDAKVLE